MGSTEGESGEKGGREYRGGEWEEGRWGVQRGRVGSTEEESGEKGGGEYRGGEWGVRRGAPKCGKELEGREDRYVTEG